jgi:hypothetical protein
LQTAKQPFGQASIFFFAFFKHIKIPTIVVEVQLAGAEDQADERRAGDF